MVERLANLRLPEGMYQVKVLQFEGADRNRLLALYRSWRLLCDDLTAFKARAVNLPEGLSESSVCLEMGFVRVIGNISGANSSWDCYDISRWKRIQIKACSVLPDLTSFGPDSVWDEIYFVDFYRGGTWDGTFDIYLIDNDDIYNHKVNARQTLRAQQEQGRRPRFSIYKEIIQKKGLRPTTTGRLL
jgi:hypothetical protein